MAQTPNTNAQFCELNNDNLVIEAIEVSKNDASTEEAGIAFLKNLYKDPSRRWVQTWPDDNGKRKQQGGIGYTYDATKDIFISPQPYPSWTLDANNDWQSPVPAPTIFKDAEGKDYTVTWDDANSRWQAQNHIGNLSKWDPENLSWVPLP